MADIERTLARSKSRNARTIIILAAVLFVCAAISVSFGAAKIDLRGLFDPVNSQIVRMRAARIALAIIAGGGLSVAGVILQGLLRNPLCEPYVLGISSGASLGAVVAAAFGIGGNILGFGAFTLFAFLGAAASLFIVYMLSRVNGRVPLQNLLLTGVIVGAVISSISIFIVFTSQNEAVHNVIWWLLGNLQIFDTSQLVLVALAVAIGVVSSLLLSKELNAISLGEEEALHLGVDVERLKKILFLITSLITGAIVSVTGMIGFVGLIVPHFMRLLTGPDQRVLIPSSLLAGGIFLVLCDLVSRTAIIPSEIPVGVITAIIGGPFFIILLRRKSKI